MTLKELQAKGLLESRSTSRDEILRLLSIAGRDLKDADVKGVSLDARFERAYNAAMILAKAVLRCHGYRPKGGGQHWTTFEVLREIGGPWTDGDVDYFHKCRKQRHKVQYEYAHVVSASQLKDLVQRACAFRDIVKGYIEQGFPQYWT